MKSSDFKVFSFPKVEYSGDLQKAPVRLIFDGNFENQEVSGIFFPLPLPSIQRFFLDCMIEGNDIGNPIQHPIDLLNAIFEQNELF